MQSTYRGWKIAWINGWYIATKNGGYPKLRAPTRIEIERKVDQQIGPNPKK